MKKLIFLTILSILYCSLPSYAKDNVEEYVGVYTLRDEANIDWTITLNEDKTVVFESSKGAVYYGNFDTFPYYCPCLSFPWSDSPMISFPAGKQKIWFLSIISDDGYLYDSNTNYKAKHPKHRLKITKK